MDRGGQDNCTGSHELYVAEVVGLEDYGKLIVITVCRHCDRVKFHEYSLGGAANMRLLQEEKKEK